MTQQAASLTAEESPPIRERGYSLAREFYVSDQIFRADIAGIFSRQWFFAAPLAAFRGAGDFVTLSVGDNPLLLVRGDDGEIRGFHNVCRHRGSQVCGRSAGRVKKLVCPYHQWVYELDGRLAYASHMPVQPDADSHSLHRLHTAILGGGVYICLADSPPPIDDAQNTIGEYTAPYNVGRFKIVLQEMHSVGANWKLLVENNRECGHCRSAHPELMSCVYDFGLGGDSRTSAEYDSRVNEMEAECARLGLRADAINFPGDSFFRLARLPFRPGYLSEVASPEKIACRKMLGDATPSLGQLRVVTLPNAWGHYLADYCVITRLLPQSPRESSLAVYWMVRDDAEADSDFSPDSLAEVWRETTAQDIALVENNQRGVNSQYYLPGPYSPITEAQVEHFVDWYCRRLQSAM